MVELLNGNRIAEWQNGGMAEWRNGGMAGMAGMAVMADGMVKWRGRNGRMAEMATYVLFTVHTDDDTDTDLKRVPLSNCHVDHDRPSMHTHTHPCVLIRIC